MSHVSYLTKVVNFGRPKSPFRLFHGFCTFIADNELNVLIAHRPSQLCTGQSISFLFLSTRIAEIMIMATVKNFVFKSKLGNLPAGRYKLFPSHPLSPIASVFFFSLEKCKAACNSRS